MCVMWGLGGFSRGSEGVRLSLIDGGGVASVHSSITYFIWVLRKRKRKREGRGGPCSSKNIRPVSPPCFLYPPEPEQEQTSYPCDPAPFSSLRTGNKRQINVAQIDLGQIREHVPALWNFLFFISYEG